MVINLLKQSSFSNEHNLSSMLRRTEKRFLECRKLLFHQTLVKKQVMYYRHRRFRIYFCLWTENSFILQFSIMFFISLLQEKNPILLWNSPYKLWNTLARELQESWEGRKEGARKLCALYSFHISYVLVFATTFRFIVIKRFGS
jgi:hypothetical protein